MTADANSPRARGVHHAQAPSRHGPELLAVGAGNVSVLLLGLVSGVIASRVLGPALRGEFVAAQTWAATTAVILTLGVTQAVVTYRGEDKRLVGPLLLQVAGTLALGAALFMLLSVAGQVWLRPAGIVGGAALTTSSLVSSVSSGLAQRLGRMRGAFQRVRLLPQIFGVIAVGAVWASGTLNPNFWLLAVGLGMLAPSALLLGGLLGGVRTILRPRNFRPPAELVRSAAAALLIVVGAQLIYRLDSLLVAAYLSPSKVALYAVAVSAATACAAIGQAVGMLTFSHLRRVDDTRVQRRLIRQGTLRALAVTTAVSVPFATFAPWAIRVVYGSAFVPATGAARLLTIAAIPLAADYLLSHALLALSAGRTAFKVQLPAAILTLGLLAAAIHRGNLELVALVSVVVYTLSSSLLFVAVLRCTRPRLSAEAVHLFER